jgi:hypothetical protein
MIKDFLGFLLFGIAMHQTRRTTETWPYGWRNNAEHAIGGVGMLLAWPHWYARLHDMPDGKRRGWVALALAFLSVGAGVVIGWVLDGVGEK